MFLTLDGTVTVDGKFNTDRSDMESFGITKNSMGDPRQL
jgi:hypothetical protein